METTDLSEDEFAEFTPNSEVDYYMNAVVVLLCFISTALILIHTIHQWIWRARGLKPKEKKKLRPIPKIMYSAIFSLITALVYFAVHCLDLWFLRIFPPHSFHYDAEAFCERFVISSFLREHQYTELWNEHYIL